MNLTAFIFVATFVFVLGILVGILIASFINHEIPVSDDNGSTFKTSKK